MKGIQVILYYLQVWPRRLAPITITVYNMAAVDFSTFLGAFVPHFLQNMDGLDTDQRTTLRANFKTDTVVDQSDCGASVGNTKITDLVFADDAVIFAESLEVLVMALEALHEEAKPLGLEVSWLKTKVQVFGDLLDEAVQSVHACGKDIEILESFTYLGSAVHNDGGSRQEVLRRIGIAHGVMDSLSGSIWSCRYLCRRTKIRIFKSLVIPVLLYGGETWALNSDLKRRINAFGNMCLRRIMGYRWDDYVSNQRLHRETESRPITCIVRQRQLRLYGNVSETIEHFLLQCPRFDSHHVVLCSQLLTLNVATFDLPTLLAAAGLPPGTSAETIEHFLLQCPRFHSHRVVLRSQLLTLNVATCDLPTLLAAAVVHPSRQHAVIRLTCAFLRKTGTSETIEHFLLPPARWQHAQRSYCLHLGARHSRFTCTASVSPLTTTAPDAGTSLETIEHSAASRQVAACSADVKPWIRKKSSVLDVTLTRLRLGHTTLTANLHRLRLSPDPHCPWCRNVSETIEHFLLQCPRFHSHHVVLHT
ncbi:Exportin-6-B [Chionoecetes opilio]|uniref:Exportin-6-B n=1 Tax=Chionoecetes opilio TaxID=41210 RepID=A0A8J5D4V3_CHIOP|nr:Exportin-6-B [Chionoecetes opilio]